MGMGRKGEGGVGVEEPPRRGKGKWMMAASFGSAFEIVSCHSARFGE